MWHCAEFRLRSTSLPAQNASFGSILIRRTFINNTGAPLTRLRFRIVDLSTFPSPLGTSDLRPRTSAGGLVPIGGTNPACPGGNCPMQVLTLEQPPSQPNGGGFNSSLGANTVTLGTPVANGAGINVEVLFGSQQVGCLRFVVIAEAVPGGTSEISALAVPRGRLVPVVLIRLLPRQLRSAVALRLRMARRSPGPA